MRKVEAIKADFLNEEHKKIKCDYMDKLMLAFPEIVLPYLESEKINELEFTDIMLSVLMMFSREILTGFFLNSNALEDRNPIMDTIFKTIKSEVNERIANELKLN